MVLLLLFFKMILAILFLKSLEYLIIAPLRLKHFYQKQGVNCKYWHPFHFLVILYEGYINKDESYSVKKLFS
jgi:hypothetical protein